MVPDAEDIGQSARFEREPLAPLIDIILMEK
jgi:hypothetical protein